MGDGGGFFRGTSQDQDSRFSDKEKKLIKSTKFPPEFEQKVDMKKVKFEIIKPWITSKIVGIFGGLEDEVLIGYVFSLLEEKQNPDPKHLQINLTGFLATDAGSFVLQLWKLLLSAQSNIGGIPTSFLEKKKEEIKQKKAEIDRLQGEIGKKMEKDQQQYQDNIKNGVEIKQEGDIRKETTEKPDIQEKDNEKKRKSRSRRKKIKR